MKKNELIHRWTKNNNENLIVSKKINDVDELDVFLESIETDLDRKKELDLRGVCLEDAVVYNVGLCHGLFDYAVFKNCQFKKVDFQRSSFKECVFENCIFEECNITGVLLVDSVCKNIKIFSSNAFSSRYENSSFKYCFFKNTPLDRSSFKGSSFNYVKMESCDFFDVKLNEFQRDCIEFIK